ncbi:MAG: hypothetical protein DMG40_27075 [Acidobacteria bacterium]|nr:MAG: hypothetical protein DMG40_27075 [Acidobacteriota bacterium]
MIRTAGLASLAEKAQGKQGKLVRHGSEMKIRSAFLGVFLFLCGLCVAPPALSQGCAMCSSYVSASTKAGQRAVNKAVLLLLIPAAGFMSGGMVMAYRYSRKRDLEQG